MTLFIVSTPIGNLQDITLRAAKTLLSVPYIITESASKTNNLLEFIRSSFPNIPNTPNNPKIVSYSENEEDIKLASMIRIIEANDAALVSEAGTPLISDPGFKLVREAIKRGINIIPIPGPTAVIATLVVSGLPPNNFWFLGYLPKKIGQKEKILTKLVSILSSIDIKSIKPTLIIYESPHRLIETLKAIKQAFGNIDIVIARELTKIHEEVKRETVSEAINYFTLHAPKGEFVLIF